MIWSSFSDFIHMHGYAEYVWGSFGVTFLIFLIEQRNLNVQYKKMIKSEEI
jgi:heme exporter protein D